MQTDEPEVLTWMAIMAPRPQARVSAPGHHWWREYVTEEWRAAYQAWWLHREEVAIGYATEMREFEAEHPAPRLADFMRALSRGSWSQEALA